MISQPHQRNLRIRTFSRSFSIRLSSSSFLLALILQAMNCTWIYNHDILKTAIQFEPQLINIFQRKPFDHVQRILTQVPGLSPWPLQESVVTAWKCLIQQEPVCTLQYSILVLRIQHQLSKQGAWQYLQGAASKKGKILAVKKVRVLTPRALTTQEAYSLLSISDECSHWIVM